MDFLNLRVPKRTSGTIFLGKYELGRRLGSGSFAKVHVARSIQTGELIAVKIIDKKKTSEAHMEPRIIREIEAMRRLHDHPNILKIHEVMATKSKIYLIMEFATGGELFEKLINSGRPNEAQARLYFQKLLFALSFCHHEGIVHRDVKPQNLLLDKDGNLKVCDFGSSSLPEHRTRQGLLVSYCGIPAYTSLEVIGQRAYDGAKVDAWSCGVVLFVMFAGYLPFDDSNIAVMWRKMNKRDYRFPSKIPRPVRTIIYNILDPNPATRMSIEDVMGTNWFKKSLEIPVFKSSLFKLDRFLVKEVKPSNGVTAFDLITLSSGWNLSQMFGRRKMKEKRFTVKVLAQEVVEMAAMIGGKLGFRVEKKEEARVVGLGKARTVIVVEVMDLVQGLVLVNVKVVEGEEEEESH